MVELFADAAGDSTIFEGKKRFKYENWYDYSEASTESFQIGFYHHGARDEGDWKTISEDGVIGMVYGYFSCSPLDDEVDLIKRILTNPKSTLEALEGSFTLICADDNRLVVAVDKLGSRQIYYTPGSPGAVATHPGALVPLLKDPEPNIRSISEVLQTGFAWGEKTLIKGVRAVPTSSYLICESGDIETERYWQFSGEPKPENYVYSVYEALQNATDRVASTIPNEADVGTYLSGGLDSRLLCGLIRNVGMSPTSFTYDANPGGGENLEPAKELAKGLSIENELLDYSPEASAEYIEDAVLRTSGLQSWHEFHGLPGKLEKVPGVVNTIFWGAGQGELFGEDIPHNLCKGNPVEKFTEYWKSDISERVLHDSPDLRETFKQEYQKQKRDSVYDQATDLIFRNYYSNAHARANVERTVAGFRCVHADSEVIEKSTPVPPSYRWGPVQEYLNLFGHSISPLKLRLVREQEGPVSRIKYERTGVSPERSIYIHDMAAKIKGLMGDTDEGLHEQWYRENSEIQEIVNEYVEDASVRSFVDGDALLNLTEEECGSTSHIDALAKMSTIEIWLQNYFDPFR